MSRVGTKPVTVPKDVRVTIGGQDGPDHGWIEVAGPKGELTHSLPQGIRTRMDDDKQQLLVLRADDSKQRKALHGLTRSIIANMVQGVVQPYSKRLEVIGVGFNVRLQGRTLVVQVDLSHPVEFSIPEGIDLTIESPTNPGRVLISGCSKQLVGQTAAAVRAIRPPEPYKGKGIKYEDEQIRRKAGKAFASG